MYTGRQGNYYWLEDAATYPGDLLRLCPETVLDKYLVITSFGGGPLRLTEEEFRNGWMRHDDLAINPSVASVSHIPYDQPGEWYIFHQTPLLEKFKVFVNYSSFTLRDPNCMLEGADLTRDTLAGGDQADKIRELQELFWLQAELKGVETYIGAGERLVVVTRQQRIYERYERYIKEKSSSV